MKYHVVGSDSRSSLRFLSVFWHSLNDGPFMAREWRERGKAKKDEKVYSPSLFIFDDIRETAHLHPPPGLWHLNGSTRILLLLFFLMPFMEFLIPKSSFFLFFNSLSLSLSSFVFLPFLFLFYKSAMKYKGNGTVAGQSLLLLNKRGSDRVRELCGRSNPIGILVT